MTFPAKEPKKQDEVPANKKAFLDGAQLPGRDTSLGLAISGRLKEVRQGQRRFLHACAMEKWNFSFASEDVRMLTRGLRKCKCSDLEEHLLRHTDSINSRLVIE
jgi:hypothetical protein